MSVGIIILGEDINYWEYACYGLLDHVSDKKCQIRAIDPFCPEIGYTLVVYPGYT